MTTFKPTWTPPTDEEIEAQYRQGEKAYERIAESGRYAVSAKYDRGSDRVIVELANGTAFLFPPAIAQGLGGATPAELDQVEVSPGGLALNWDNLDTGFTVEGLLNGIFGTRVWMEQVREAGRKGGKVSSEAKTAAARANGKKGGRPRKRAV
jgi:hypothetical protein